ncbi:OsmC-like protein [Cristinia sonorae]|uniref:OsmC-like protein n=1 Tax=Cristinia sonorae TaxID=1940300 RepID=A0A8K0UYM2_9AGAR|nr:OsmC-like protein [Cristinia sonorae]
MLSFVLRRGATPMLRTGLASRRTLMSLENTKYTARATASGQGRNGTVKSTDEAGLELHLAMPKALGGKGDGQNPEQLLAMGYSACFLGAMQMVAGQQGKTDAARNAKVHAQVHLGKPKDMKGFGLAVDIQVEGVDDQALIDGAHAPWVCKWDHRQRF